MKFFILLTVLIVFVSVSFYSGEIKSIYYDADVIETFYDTISVTDTLIINAVLTSIPSPDNINTLKVYPNPAKDYIFINTGDYTRMSGYRLKIVSQLAATVYETKIEDALYEVNLNSWKGKGMYFVYVIDSDGKIIDIKKVIIE